MQKKFYSHWWWLPLLALALAGCDEDGDSSSSDNPGYGYTVSGTISVSGNTAVDSDVNDERTVYRANDNMNSAQAIPNPAIIGGYVNQPGSGPAGRSRDIGDTVDYYQADLSAGQGINLYVGSADIFFNDLDLYLVDANGYTVAASESRGDTESVTVPNSGRFFVVVQAYRGASNYVLSLGQGNTAQSARGMRLEDEFAPGQVTLRFKSEIKSPSAARALAAREGLKTLAGEPSRRMLFSLEDEGQFSAQTADGFRFRDESLKRKHQTLQAIKRLQQRPEVAEANPNYIFRAQRVPNDSLYRYQWHYPMMRLPQAWDITTGNREVVVAVVDTGILSNHPDMRGQISGGYDFISDRDVSLDGDGVDGNPEDPGDQSSGGSTFHGTHVAGTIGALTNNGDGVAGSGWQTRIMPLRVLGKSGIGYDYDIEQAVRYAAGLSNDSGQTPAKPADVINLSLGGETISSGFQSLINQARARGTIVVAASGNDGKNILNYPAALNGVVSVGAVDINRRRAYYSNYHSTVEVAAPGGDVSTDINGDGVNDGIVSSVGDDSQGNLRYIFAPSMGTSMATPHVAGVIALMKAVNPGLTPQDFDNLLSSGQITEDLGTPGRDNSYGYGLLDAYRAVVAAVNLAGNQPAPSVPPELNITPANLNFGLMDTSQILTLGNAGGGSLRVERITRTAEFVSVVPTTVDNNGLGTYTITVNRSLLTPGTHTATLNFISNANSVKVEIILQVSDQAVAGDAGRQYVLLVKPEDPTGDPVQQVPVSAGNGAYQFSFKGVPAGRYQIISGSDNNQDLYICDDAESCGGYLTIDRPSVINVDRNLSGLNFAVNFNTAFISRQSLAVDGDRAAPESRRGFRRLSEDHSEQRRISP